MSELFYDSSLNGSKLKYNLYKIINLSVMYMLKGKFCVNKELTCSNSVIKSIVKI